MSHNQLRWPVPRSRQAEPSRSRVITPPSVPFTGTVTPPLLDYTATTYTPSVTFKVYPPFMAPATAPAAPAAAPSAPPKPDPAEPQRRREKAEQAYTAGVHFFINQQLDEAIRSWELTLSLNPEHPKAAKDIEKARALQQKLRDIR